MSQLLHEQCTKVHGYKVNYVHSPYVPVFSGSTLQSTNLRWDSTIVVILITTSTSHQPCVDGKWIPIGWKDSYRMDG